MTKGFGEKIAMENTEKDSLDYMKPTQECMSSSPDVVSDPEMTSWKATPQKFLLYSPFLCDFYAE